MKKVFSVLFIVFIISVGAFAQRQVHLAMRYQPQHKYAGSTDQITNMEIGFHSESADGQKALEKAMGGESPVKKTVNAHSETMTQAGKLFKDSLFSIKTVFTKVQTADGSSPIPIGTAVYSTGSKSGQVTFESLAADGMDSELKEKLLPMLKSILQQVVVPEHNAKIGETFSFETPLTFPISGFTLDFTISTDYILKSISNGMAYFDIKQKYVMKSESVAIPITATGTGSGTMSYDIDNSYFSKYELSNVMSMAMNTSGVEMKIKIESTSIQKVGITKGN